MMRGLTGVQVGVGRVVRQVIVLSATFLSLFPVYFMVVSAFKTKPEYLANKWGLPQSIFLDNFVTAFSGEKFFSPCMSTWRTIAARLKSTFATKASGLRPTSSEVNWPGQLHFSDRPRYDCPGMAGARLAKGSLFRAWPSATPLRPSPLPWCPEDRRT